ncbi:MAG: pyruvate dehydrogenase (acetyl-transferring), homodimeric type [Burkholderiales bacterium]|nr:pyruvate dehydrogenase (acetyl-transferring), homodimeric type [Burkholderiales bacterium]
MPIAAPDIQALLHSIRFPGDADPTETREWLDALTTLAREAGPARARFVLDALQDESRRLALAWKPARNTPYVNTIAVGEQAAFPGQLEIEQRLAAIMRWNALAMVVRANERYGELGGHIASYASAADLFEVGFNHFFRARSAAHGGDLVFFQPHSAPGVYARAFVEGRLSEDDLLHYRQELRAAAAGARGLSSYPHPWLMPDFWQFPTGSMGLGPLSAVYQARFMRYLQHRGLAEMGDRRGTNEDAPPERRRTSADATPARRVWGFFGDGEMDEPESLAGLSLAAREGLDNLVFVVNCNLQRLDGPVRGNGRIVDELETLFEGAGWHVIKLLWGSDWDGLFARDTTQALVRAFARTVDGQFQTFSANDGAYNRARFFGQDPELASLVAAMTDDEIDRLHRGGHDLVKIHAAYAAAVAHRGTPVVILAKTMKGYGMGAIGQGRMTTHSQKKLDAEDLKAFARRLRLPMSDEDAAAQRFFRPADDSPEMQHLRERRVALGGPMPARCGDAPALAVPAIGSYAAFALDAAGKEMSTTMAFVRLLSGLLKDRGLGARVVPIVADEARTFGMASLFRQVGIYAPQGQRYEPEDAGSLMAYREARDGQILEEGISEAGAIASWTAAATSYSTHGLPMLPFYVYYSMFGFQRVGDLIWAAADQRARGFLVGATSGRTTLGGEGLQHQDGHSHLLAATVPNCVAYDPAFGYELAVLVQHGLQRLLQHRDDVFFYLTVTNENLAQPSLPAGAEEGIVRGLYRLRAGGIAPAAPPSPAARCTLLGSGAILHEVLAAAALLAADWNVAAEVCSVTSFSELAREAMAVERRGDGGDAVDTPYVMRALAQTEGPIVAATDYVRAVPEQIRAWIPAGRRYATLGTDGFGRSDTRAELRRFFEVDRHHVVWRALRLLAADGRLPRESLDAARRRYAVPAAPPPWTR